LLQNEWMTGIAGRIGQRKTLAVAWLQQRIIREPSLAQGKRDAAKWSDHFALDSL
jgi:hypothetical protein